MPEYGHNSTYIITSIDLPMSSPPVHPGFPSGGSGAIGENAWVITASSSSGAYGNGLTYTPLVQGAADNIDIEFVSSLSGNVELIIQYAMSAANAGDVELKLDHLILGATDDPATAVTAQTAFTVTPGNDDLIHSVSSTDDATLAIAVTEGDSVRLILTRPTGGGDTHTGDMRILQMRIASV